MSKAECKSLAEKTADATAADIEDLFIEIKPSAGKKCERCWQYTESVGTIAGHETICSRCLENIEGDGEVRKFA